MPKQSTESKFTTERKNRYGDSKTVQRVLRNACFFLSRKKRHENGSDSKKNYGAGKISRTS